MGSVNHDLELVTQALYRAPCGAVIASTAADGDILYVNSEFTRITGYTIDDVPDVGTWLVRAYPDEDYRAFVLGNWERDVSEPGRDVVYRVTCKEGTVKKILLRASLLPGERMVVTLLDVTEHLQIERELRESNERYRSLYESLPVGMAVHTAEQIVFVNSKARQILGLTEDEDVSRYAALDFIHPEQRESTARRMQAVLDGQGPPPWLEERFVRPDGTEILAETGGALIDWHGQPALQVVFVDITARKRAEEERRRMEARVQQAQKMESLGVLAGGVAHDFNNLLVGILGNADLALADLPPSSPVRPIIEDIELAARRAADLARQMLAYSGRGRFVAGRLDLQALIEEIAHLMEASISRKAVLRYEFDAGVPPIEGDATQVRQVVMNLLANAAEAIGEGSGVITVATGVTECDAASLADIYADQALSPGLYSYVEISDTGAGMAEDTLARIFEPFFTTKFAGRGLGLAAVMGIVKGHRGVIMVDSEPARGTTFKVLFPAVEGASERAVSGAAPDADAAESACGTVLVVDDEEAVRTVAARMLRRGGFRVILAEDGREALSVISQRGDEIDCVLLDLGMPHLDGRETIRELSRIRTEVPIVLSSGYDEEDAIESIDAARPVGFVQKPYRAATLLAAIRAALS